MFLPNDLARRKTMNSGSATLQPWRFLSSEYDIISKQTSIQGVHLNFLSCKQTKKPHWHDLFLTGMVYFFGYFPSNEYVISIDSYLWDSAVL